MVFLDMNSYDQVTNDSLEQHPQPSITPRRRAAFVGIVAMMVLLFGASVSAAQADEDASEVGTDVTGDAGEQAREELTAAVDDSDAAATERVESELQEREEEIETLEQQVGLLQQALIGFGAQATADEGRIIPAGAVDPTSSEFQADAMAQWRIGYAIGGGQNLTAFENTILPCESGSQRDPDVAVGRTDDWGRAQINRPTWKARFESLTGANFEENIVHPVLNGFMAAHVEGEQGLTAWTCWRNR